MRRSVWAIASCLVLTVPAAGQAVPDWVARAMQEQVGTWVASNTDYMSEAETDDAYGQEWTWGVGRHSLVGRLYGLRGGEETGHYWDFRMYWDPQERALKLVQYGSSGVFGIGSFTRVTEVESEVVQWFTRPDGSGWRGGHRTEHASDRHVGSSYTISDDGAWTLNRTYTWERVR